MEVLIIANAAAIHGRNSASIAGQFFLCALCETFARYAVKSF